MNITDINNLLYAAATNMTQTLNEPSKRNKSRRDVKFWKIRMQKQISSWRKELSIIAETGQALIMESLTEKEEDFSKIQSDKHKGSCTVDRNVEAESASKSPKN